MSKAAKRKANRNYRARLAQRGIKRFEVIALESDRKLIRRLARRLAEDGPEADQTRATVKALVEGKPSKPGGILAALRRSPLIGANLDLSRPRVEGQKVEL